MAVSRNISVVVATGFKSEGIERAQKQLDGLGKRLHSLGANALKVGASFAAFQGTRAIVDFASGAIAQSRDLERNMNGLVAVFGEMAPQMIEFTENSHKLGLSQSEAAKSVTFIGSVLKQSGFAIGETADLTERLIGLGTDLSITYGYDVQEALLGMTALFRGEYDPIEKFGVAMKQSEIESVKVARGLDKLTGAGERLADQQIRLELLFERSADAQGQYAAQSDGLFVAQQNLEATFKNMQATAGQVLTPAFADLTLAITPLVERLTPVLANLMQQLVPILINAANNTEQLEETINKLANGITFVVGALGKLLSIAASNIGVLSNLAVTMTSVLIAGRGFAALAGLINLVTVSVNLSTAAMNRLKFAMAATGVGLIAVGVGFLASKFLEAKDNAADFATDLPKLNLQLGQTAEAAALAAERVQYFKAGLSLSAAEFATRDFKFTPQEIDSGLDEGEGEAGEKARDYIKEFYDGLKDEVAKQEAKIKLENLNATSGLIEAILGSGEEWKKVFDNVIKDGAKSVAAAQLLFTKTSAGLEEITKRVEEANAKLKEEYEAQKTIYDDAVKAFEAFEVAANAAGDAFGEFLSEMSTLSTFESAMGKFESAVTSDLSSIEQKLDDAFDNGFLLDESYSNLQSYVRSEYTALQAIARQRDQLLDRRNLAEALLKDVKNATVAAGNITSILKDTATETTKINMTKVVQDTVQAGKYLKDFRVTIISDFVEPIAEAASKSELLVDGFRAVVERTKLFVDNLKALRQLGLDPLLFNQLVEAGVEAGGETAQALIDGGADTINEVNTLFGELDSLGQELGEQTAQVMYGEGQEFVNGIIEGLDSMLEDLESTAVLLANTFVDAFSAILAEGIAKAIAAAQAAVPSAPAAPVFESVAAVVEEVEKALEEVAGEIEEVVEVVEEIVSSGSGSGSGDSGGSGEAPGSVRTLRATPTLDIGLFQTQLMRLQEEKRLTSSLYSTQYGTAYAMGPKVIAGTTINLTVQDNNRLDGQKGGEAALAALQQYGIASGNTNIARLLK